MAGQVGWKREVTWGTAVTVDTFMPVVSSNLSVDEGWMRPKGIRAARRTRNLATLGARKVSGSVNMEFPNTSIASLLKDMFGAVNTTGAGPYTHTFTPGTADESLTLQTGITDAAGTVQPFTASGVKLDSWELSANVGEFAMLSFDWTGKDIVTATALASASYASTLVPFTFVQASLTVNGSAVASARKVSLKAAKNLRNDRFVLGSRNILQQLEEERFDFTGTIEADFDSLTIYNLQVAGTAVALVVTLSNGTDSLTVTANIQVFGDAPNLDQPGLEPQTINFEVGHGTTDATAITAVLISATEVTAP